MFDGATKIQDLKYTWIFEWCVDEYMFSSKKKKKKKKKQFKIYLLALCTQCYC